MSSYPESLLSESLISVLKDRVPKRTIRIRTNDKP